MDEVLTVDDIHTLASALFADVGAAWFNERSSQGGTRAQHPLVEARAMFRHVFASPNPKAGDVPATLLDMALAARDVYLLRRAGTPGIDKRVTDMLGGSQEQFLSTIHELHSAADFLRGGHRVEFLDTSTEATPDLLVDGVEVECKRKLVHTQADLARHRLYEDLQKRLQKRVAHRASGRGLFVRIEGQGEPSSLLLRTIESHSPRVLDEAVGMQWQHGELAVSMAPAEPLQAPTPIDNLRVSGADLRSSDITLMSFKAEPGDGIVSNLVSIYANTVSKRNFQSSYEKTLRSASSKQLSGKRPGVVAVDLSELARHLPADRQPELEHVTQRVLQRHRSLSAVMLSARMLAAQEPNEKIVRVVRVFIVNSMARHPLPEGWVSGHSTLEDALEQMR